MRDGVLQYRIAQLRRLRSWQREPWHGDLMEPKDSCRDAARILRAVGATRPPIDLGAIAERCRLRIRYRQDLPVKVAGFLYRGPMYDVIVVNAHHSWVRRRFTIGHEIGHWYLGDSIISLSGSHYDRHRESERVVDSFAVELLMPWELVCEARQQGHSVSVLAHQFQVSRAAMKRRLCELGAGWVEESYPDLRAGPGVQYTYS